MRSTSPQSVPFVRTTSRDKEGGIEVSRCATPQAQADQTGDCPPSGAELMRTPAFTSMNTLYDHSPTGQPWPWQVPMAHKRTFDSILQAGRF